MSKALRKAAGILCMVVLTLSVSVPAYAVEPDKAKETAETSSSSASETETEATTEEQTAAQEPKPTTASEKTATEKKGDKAKTEKVHNKKKKSKKKSKKKKDKKKDKEKKIVAPEDAVSVRSETALAREEKLKRQLLKEESLEQSLLHADKLKEEIQKFYQALNEQSGSVAIPGVVALTGVKKDGNDTQIGHRVNHLLLELSVKTKNGYLKDIAENYNFDVAGEMKVADVIEDEETIQLKQYLDQQILNCDKTQEQRLRELKKSNLSVEEIRLMLKGSALEEEAPAFYKCEKKYGVNAVVVMGIAIHESAWGTSRRAREDHNLTGYGVTSDSAKGINAPTKEENLLMTAKLLKEKYLVKGGAYYHGPTVKGVNQCYCVGNTWAGYVTNRCYEIMKRL